MPREVGHPAVVRPVLPRSGTGVIALTLTYGAYMAEVYRAGIEAVPHGADGGRAASG